MHTSANFQEEEARKCSQKHTSRKCSQKQTSAEQIWEEIKKYAYTNPYKHHKLEPVWDELSYQEYLASLSPILKHF